MESEIKKLRAYLNKRLNETYIPNSGGSLQGMSDKIQALKDEIEKFNTQDVKFANNILVN